MSDDEDDRLTIDEGNDFSLDERNALKKEENTNNRDSIETLLVAPSPTEPLEVEHTTSFKEQIESTDSVDETNMPAHAVSKPYCNKFPSNPEKRPNIVIEMESPAKRCKLSTESLSKDASSSVNSRAMQTECEESLFDLEPGSSFHIQLSVACRIDGSNTIYVSGKWRDMDISGVLSDGDAPSFLTKKRYQPNGPSPNGTSETGSDRSSVSGTPLKKRAGRNGQQSDRDKRRLNRAENDEDEDLDVTGTQDRCSSNVNPISSVALIEVPPRENMHVCDIDGCRHRYESFLDLDYHISAKHKKPVALTESSSSQTHTTSISQRSVAIGTSDFEQTNIAELKVNHVPLKREEDVFSDISDDGAPQLQKEEPQLVDQSRNLIKKQDFSSSIIKPLIPVSQNVPIPVIAGPSSSSDISPALPSSAATPLRKVSSPKTSSSNGMPQIFGLTPPHSFPQPILGMPISTPSTAPTQKFTPLRNDNQDSMAASAKATSSPVQPRPFPQMGISPMAPHGVNPVQPIFLPQAQSQAATPQQIQMLMRGHFPGAANNDQMQLLLQMMQQQYALPHMFQK